ARGRNGNGLSLEIGQCFDFGLRQYDLRYTRPGAADYLDTGSPHASDNRFRRTHVNAVDLAGDERFHQCRAGLDLQKFDLQTAFGSKTAFVDHSDKACIAFGFEDAVLPDFFLRVDGGNEP